MIEAHGITVQYGQFKAVNDVTLTVTEGEVVGIVGPNGAGKTTLMECIEGLRDPTQGSISVAGINPHRDRPGMARIAGVQLQHSMFPPRTLTSDICKLFAGFYRDPADYRPLLERFGLAEQAKTPIVKMSGGQQQRLALVLALIGQPRVVFLDELTTGLDPAARRVIWEELRQRNESGLTVLLTSHHMEEIEYLCDRVNVLVQGQILAQGTPAALINAHSRESLEISGSLPELAGLDGVEVTTAGKRTHVKFSDPSAKPKVDQLIAEHGLSARPLNASLEDAYLNLTGEKAYVQ